MIASLPMYDLPPLRDAHDRLWSGVRAALGQGPNQLTRGGDLWDHWRAPDLLLSQTCGYPYRAVLHDQVRLVGTPDYALPGCPPGHYNSVFIARRDDPRGDLPDYRTARFAYNEPMSQSGWAAPAHHVAQLGFAFETLLKTGAHRASAQAVAEGRADLAALDAQTWRLLQRHEGFAGALREITRTAPTPALPYITAASQPRAPIFAALEQAIAGLSIPDRDLLGLQGIVHIPSEAYLAVPTPPPPAG